jgi:hypothetical protein
MGKEHTAKELHNARLAIEQHSKKEGQNTRRNPHNEIYDYVVKQRDIAHWYCTKRRGGHNTKVPANDGCDDKPRQTPKQCALGSIDRRTINNSCN